MSYYKLGPTGITRNGIGPTIRLPRAHYHVHVWGDFRSGTFRLQESRDGELEWNDLVDAKGNPVTFARDGNADILLMGLAARYVLEGATGPADLTAILIEHHSAKWSRTNALEIPGAYRSGDLLN